MLVRRIAAGLALLASTALTPPAWGQTVQTTAEGAGEAARGCVVYPRGLSGEGEAGDYVGIEPRVAATVQVEGGQLCLGGLAYGTRYTVTMRAGLRFADGGRQAGVVRAVIETPDRAAAVAVAGRGWILPRVGATGVTVQTMNVPLVRVRVLRVSAQRLTAERGRGRIDPGKQVFSPYELQRLAEGDATEVWSGTLRTRVARNVAVETAFPLAGVVDAAKPGAYLVLVEDAARPAVTLEASGRYDAAAFDDSVAGHWVLSTDLAIATAQGLDGLHVAVRSFGQGTAVAGVRLQLLSVGQDVLGEAVTDGAGAASFAAGLLRGKRGAAAAVLMARTAEGDMALQDLTAPAFDLADRGAEGRASPGPVEAYLYTDRGVYRPGETVNLVALLRMGGLEAVDGAALTVVVRRPDGVEASRTVLPPAPDAGFVQAVALSRTAAQGNWTIEAYVDPSLPAVGRVGVQVQDFVPQQLAVTLTGPGVPLVAGGRLVASLDGRFLYGAPGAGLHAEGDVRLVRDEHPVADARDYVFGVADEVFPSAPQPLELGVADAGGHVAIDVAVEVPDGVVSPLRAVVDAGLTEPTGRAVRQTISVPVRTHALLIGVRPQFRERVNAGSAAGFDVRAFDGEGRAVARAGLTWRLVREETHYDWWRGESGSGRWTYHTYTTDREVERGVVDVGMAAPGEVSRIGDYGTYRLIVSDGASGAASSVRFSVGWGDGSPDAGVPDKLEVSADRAVVGVGEVAHVHVQGPFAGPAQLTVESAGRVLETRLVALPGEGMTVDVPWSAAWGPGVHVLVEAFRPLSGGGGGGAHEPVRAVGLAWIGTDPAPHRLVVTMQAPGLVLPRQTVRVPVHVAGTHGRAFVTVAAVDEGILQLTKFASPDPVGALMGRTRFGLDLRDDYGRLLDGHADVGAVQEGGDEGAAALGGQGLAVSTTRVVSLFSGAVELDGAGDAVVALVVPDFAGSLRLMAVAYDHDAAGRGEAAMVVRDPVVAELALPRFLAPGDVAGVGVSLHDTDGPDGAYHLVVTASGAVAVHGAGVVDVVLARGERREARLELAGEGVGVGHVTAVLTGPEGVRVVHEWDIAVRSPHPDVVLSRTETQGPGEVYRPGAGVFARFMPGSVRLTVGYSAFAGIDVPGLLQSLYTYPYGCTEQLASAALPLLYFGDARLAGLAAGDAGVKRRVQDAIDSIVDRQDGAGRFGLWRVGDGSGSVWLNVYALDVLLHAREAGYRVPERVTRQAAQWIERRLGSDGDTEDGAYAEPTVPTRAYAAYVLARTSRVDPSRLRELAGGLELKGVVSWREVGTASALSLAQLGGAQVLMGDVAAGERSFGLAVANLDADPEAWWTNASFWTRLRDMSGVLAIAAETGQDRVAAAMLERLRREDLNPAALNTQEKAWLLVAAHALGKRGGTRTLALDGGAPAVVALPYAVSMSAAEVVQGRSVRNAGGEAVFRTVTLRGAPREAPPAVSAGFVVRRETYTLAGDRMDDAAVRQTDRFVVVLSGRVSEGAFRRAVVNDPLPAGLEIEGAVLKEEQYPFIGQLTALRAHEERDDRFIAAFDVGREARRGRFVDEDKAGTLEPESFRVAYVVRAVTPGRFVRPETVVEDMYHPDVMARTGVAVVTVSPR